jgi:cytochrome c biogenesis protein CcdA
MARKPKHSKNLKSLVGAAILGLGTFILFENLAEASARLSNLFGISREAAGMLGVLVAVGLSASHALQACLFDRQEFSRALTWILVAFWPLFLVFIGTGLLHNGSRGRVEEPPKNNPSVLKKSFSSCRYRADSFDA